MKYTWKLGGEAGYGILTTGALISRIISQLGYHVFDYVEYPSLIRGGHNAYEVIFSEEKVSAFKNEIDCLVCLNKETFEIHKHRLTSESHLIYDPNDFTPEGSFLGRAVPFRDILQKLQGQMVMRNIISLGASLAILGNDLALLDKMLEKQFERKGQKIVDFNKAFAKEGYDYIKANYPEDTKIHLSARESEPKIVITGNDAFSLGAVAGDCRFYSAYPMTPSSTVLTMLALWQEKTGMVVRHAEDEISVINTALGASFAGVRSAVGTSGGGFSLMVEALSFAGVAELPIVVFLSQRPGPATGLPTWTAQGEILFAANAGHGEFMKIVLAPGDVEEMVSLSAEAFNLADIYQTPVIVLSDMLLSESHETISKKYVDDLGVSFAVDRGKTVQEPTTLPYLRYKPEKDGISERLIPGMKGAFYQANSYEHKSDSHTTESAEDTIEQVTKRHNKEKTYLATHFKAPTVYGDMDIAQTVFVSYGSNKRIILEAMRELEKNGSKAAYIHFTHLFPLDAEKIKPLFTKDKRYVLVEQNMQGQFGKLLRMETGIHLKNRLLRFDGRPIEVEQVVKVVTDSAPLNGVVEKLEKFQ